MCVPCSRCKERVNEQPFACLSLSSSTPHSLVQEPINNSISTVLFGNVVQRQREIIGELLVLRKKNAPEHKTYDRDVMPKASFIESECDHKFPSASPDIARNGSALQFRYLKESKSKFIVACSW